MGFWMGPNLWEYEKNQVPDVYPGAQWQDIVDEQSKTRAWLLTMAPIPEASELSTILFDLQQNKGASIGHQGKIFHSEIQCSERTESHQQLFPNVKIWQHHFTVQLIYRKPPQGALFSTQPKARILSPEISAKKYPSHPHIYSNITRTDSWACPLSPQHTEWSYKKGATIEYLDQLSIWILKTMVWVATGGVVGIGKWVGADTPHNKSYLLKTVGPSEPCWCGSGRKYSNCHLQPDALQSLNERLTL